MLFIYSTSRRGVAWVPHMTGKRGRMHPHLSKRRKLSTARTAMALASNLWSSTWPVSTCWRANNPANSHLFFCSIFSLGAAHSQPHPSGENLIQQILYSPHCHAPTIEWARAVGWRWLPWVSQSLHLLSGCWIKRFTVEKEDPSSLCPGAVLPQGSLLPEAPVPLQSTGWRQSSSIRTWPLAVSLLKKRTGTSLILESLTAQLSHTSVFTTCLCVTSLFALWCTVNMLHVSQMGKKNKHKKTVKWL